MALAGRGARAQPARRRYMVVSLLAGRLHIVTARDSVGSNIDRNRRNELADQNRAFDHSALAALAAGIEAEDPGAHVDLISLPESPLHDKPEQLISGDSVALPGHLVDALDKARSSHLLLVTKYRAEARMPVVSGSIGTGWLSGVGYYIDHSTPLRMADSGNTSLPTKSSVTPGTCSARRRRSIDCASSCAVNCRQPRGSWWLPGDRRGYARATSSTSLPKFSPLKSLASVAGKAATPPVTTSSLLFMRPSLR